MHTLTIVTEIHPHKVNEFRQAARDLLNGDTHQPGRTFRSMSCDLLKDTLFCYTEVWSDADAMSTHFEGQAFHSLLGAMKLLGEIRTATIVRGGVRRKIGI